MARVRRRCEATKRPRGECRWTRLLEDPAQHDPIQISKSAGLTEFIAYPTGSGVPEPVPHRTRILRAFVIQVLRITNITPIMNDHRGSCHDLAIQNHRGIIRRANILWLRVIPSLGLPLWHDHAGRIRFSASSNCPMGNRYRNLGINRWRIRLQSYSLELRNRFVSLSKVRLQPQTQHDRPMSRMWLGVVRVLGVDRVLIELKRREFSVVLVFGVYTTSTLSKWRLATPTM